MIVKEWLTIYIQQSGIRLNIEKSRSSWLRLRDGQETRSQAVLSTENFADQLQTGRFIACLNL